MCAPTSVFPIQQEDSGGYTPQREAQPPAGYASRVRSGLIANAHMAATRRSLNPEWTLAVCGGVRLQAISTLLPPRSARPSAPARTDVALGRF